MQCRWIDSQVPNLSSVPLTDVIESSVWEASQHSEKLKCHFQTQFEGYMEMYSDPQTVADYLNAHEGWFCRCAEPMKTEPIGNNGYILTVGRFGSFGYEVEPKLAVVLQPPQDGIYWMHSIPTPAFPTPGYEVDYQASMTLQEIPLHLAGQGIDRAYQQRGLRALPQSITKVQWQLYLNVAVQFPQFIYKLPLSLIQSTGDRLLTQIVRQISPRLTYKVQQDFHERFELPLPARTSRHLQKLVVDADEQVA